LRSVRIGLPVPEGRPAGPWGPSAEARGASCTGTQSRHKHARGVPVAGRYAIYLAVRSGAKIVRRQKLLAISNISFLIFQASRTGIRTIMNSWGPE
jgi:hypothetical protein